MNIAVVGATGAVGLEILKIFDQRRFPIQTLRLFASPRSEGKTIRFRDKNHIVQTLNLDSFKEMDFVFFDASDDVSQQWVPVAIESGAWVIDNSSVFRLDPSIPLVVPEVNGDLLKKQELKKTRLISGPNCTTVQLVVPLHSLEKVFGIERVVVTTFQSVSGAGTLAIDELKDQWKSWGRSEPYQAHVLSYPIANNCIAQIGSIQADGYTSEEKKIMQEAAKILGLPLLRISATAVRIPIERGHSESVMVECKRKPDIGKWIEDLSQIPGIQLGNAKARIMPMDLSHGDVVGIDRIRLDPSHENGISFWVVSDNLRKGAALNAVQIAEELIKLH